MKDTTENYEAFLLELAKLSEVFGDTMSSMRVQAYWETIGAEVTLEEWHDACGQAISRETFHKIPMPATFLAYVDEYRLARREHLEAAQQAEHRRFLASPEGQAAEAARQAERRRQQEAHLAEGEAAGQRFRDSLVDAIPETPLNRPRHLIETLMLSQDPAVRKAFLRGQVKQILKEEKDGDETA